MKEAIEFLLEARKLDLDVSPFYPIPFKSIAFTITPALTFSLELLPILVYISFTIPISSIIPATIPRWSRFATFISVLIPDSAFSLLDVNYFTTPLRAKCGVK